MAQAMMDPEQVRRFAEELKRFNTDLQDKIVYELSQGLNLELGTSEITEIEADETQSVEAYESFSRGMINLRTGSRDSLDRAIHYFEKASELDPNYAGAWAALSAAYDLKGGFLSIPELSHKAVEFAKFFFRDKGG